MAEKMQRFGESLSDSKQTKRTVLDMIQQGAEAVLILRDGDILKRRVKKGYRIEVIDERIRKLRTRGEAKLLERAGKVINVPKVKKVDEAKTELTMEFIEGEKLSDYMDGAKEWKIICEKIGESIAKLHDEDIIHGDLTTSNMIWKAKEKKLYFIDFGLGYGNGKIEDKAVDLHLIKQALEAKHYVHWENFWKMIEEGYRTSKNSKEVLKRLEAVEKRGRYKNQD